MFCKKCGSPIKTSDAFCTGCGEKIEKEKLGKICKIIVTREKHMLGFAINFPVFIDGVNLGKLANGKSVEMEVTAGVHEIEFRCIEKTIKQEVTLTDEHEEVEVFCQANMGLIAAVAGITKVEYR